MDHQNLDLESKQSSSFRRLNDTGSSRRRSLSTFSLELQFDDNIGSDAASEAGDIGYRALHSNRTSIRGRSHFSLDNLSSSGVVVPLQENGTSIPVAPSTLNNISIIVNAGIQSEERKDVLSRYSLQKLFRLGVVGAKNDQSYMYLDLPSNMVGSFLMGWFGVVFKEDILKISDLLTIGLTTGFLGRLTTFSGWNQKMFDLSINGQWVFTELGISLGLFLVAYSIIFSIETAKGLKWLHRRSNTRSFCVVTTCISSKYRCLLTFMMMLLLMLIIQWSIFGSLAKNEFKTGSSEAQLFLDCMVEPFGVWTRLYLARFNGQGLGKNSVLKWMPFGTLATNVLAACVMAALATLKKVANTRNCNTVASGIQFGLLGCLSTILTFVDEFHSMRESKHPWRAYAYATVTFTISFVLETLMYAVPVWVGGYER